MRQLTLALTLTAILFLGIIITYVFASSPAAPPKTQAPLSSFPPKATNALWEWRPVAKIDATQLDQELTTLGNYNFNTIYLNITDYTDLYELPQGPSRDSQLAAFNQAISNYIAVAQTHNFTVQALAGNDTWADSSHWYLPALVVDFVADYNARNPQAAFSGIQFDIEPYSQPTYMANKSAVLTDFLTNYATLVTKVNSINATSTQPLAFGITVPFWFNQPVDTNAAVTFQGKTQLPYFHVLNLLATLPHSYVAIMDYRNYTQGSDGSIAIIKEALTAAEAQHIAVIIGQETGNEQPAKITFYGQSKADIQKAVLAIDQAYAANTAFLGFAVNNVSSYLALKGS